MLKTNPQANSFIVKAVQSYASMTHVPYDLNEVYILNYLLPLFNVMIHSSITHIT